jgi:pyridoxine 5-phosphate synthase
MKKPAKNKKPVKRCQLGVNIDHVATVREARKDVWPDILEAAKLAKLGGADGITIHLREDRRHIQDSDVYLIKKHIKLPLNLEMACSDEITKIAIKVKPNTACLVPEKRAEVTTEGGLDVAGNYKKVLKTVKALQKAGIKVSLFIDPIKKQIKAAQESGAEYIELHTGAYANKGTKKELQKIIDGTKYGQELGLIVNAGHGLTYENVKPIAKIKGIYELNIGHNIIARSIMTGLKKAVVDMKALLN